MLLLFMAFLLGVRHGFDLDHLATIDSITRVVKQNQSFAKFVGCLFSLGHGMVVILMSVIIQRQWYKSESSLHWLEPMGHWISIFFLSLFACLTLWNLLPRKRTLPITLKTLIIKKLFTKADNPWLIIFIGALFALSFDTFTQITLFSISATVVTGYFFSIALAIIFMLGMLTSDGLNGLVVSSIIQYADKRSELASNVIGLMIAGFSFILALIGLLQETGTFSWPYTT